MAVRSARIFRRGPRWSGGRSSSRPGRVPDLTHPAGGEPPRTATAPRGSRLSPDRAPCSPRQAGPSSGPPGAPAGLPRARRLRRPRGRSLPRTVRVPHTDRGSAALPRCGAPGSARARRSARCRSWACRRSPRSPRAGVLATRDRRVGARVLGPDDQLVVPFPGDPGQVDAEGGVATFMGGYLNPVHPGPSPGSQRHRSAGPACRPPARRRCANTRPCHGAADPRLRRAVTADRMAPLSGRRSRGGDRPPRSSPRRWDSSNGGGGDVAVDTGGEAAPPERS